MLIIWLILVPVLLGLPFAGLGSEDRKHVRTAWISGVIEMWAVFQIVAVIFIMTSGEFLHIVYTYVGVIFLLCLVGVILISGKSGNFKIDINKLLAGDKYTRIVNYSISLAGLLALIRYIKA